jgi:hypothetical protein
MQPDSSLYGASSSVIVSLLGFILYTFMFYFLLVIFVLDKLFLGCIS